MARNEFDMKLGKNNNLNGTFAIKSEKKNHIVETWTFNKARGYLRKLMVIFLDGYFIYTMK